MVIEDHSREVPSQLKSEKGERPAKQPREQLKYKLKYKQKNKQTSTDQKHSAQISPYKKLTQTTGPYLEDRNQKEERIQPWNLGKGDLKHVKFKKK